MYTCYTLPCIPINIDHSVFQFKVRLIPEKSSKLIIACAVLHNIAILLGEPDITDEHFIEPRQPPTQYAGPEEGGRIRDYLTTNYFA